MNKYILIAATALTFAACTNEEMNTVPDGKVALQVNATIQGAQTRASGTEWAEGDEIGISIMGNSVTTYSNVCYEWNGSSFTTSPENAIYFQTSESVTFCAYYPFTGIPGIAAGVLTGVSTDATNQTAENQPLIDFLYATGATASTHNPTINFTDGNPVGTTNPNPALDHSFHHCMSRITLTFEAGSGVSFSTIKPESYKLSKLVLEGSFDTATGIAKADENIQTADLEMPISSTLSSSVILFPQEVQSIGLTVKFSGNEYKATLTVPDGALQAGNNYTWTVYVTATGLDVQISESIEWNTGNSGNGNIILKDSYDPETNTYYVYTVDRLDEWAEQARKDLKAN